MPIDQQNRPAQKVIFKRRNENPLSRLKRAPYKFKNVDDDNSKLFLNFLFIMVQIAEDSILVQREEY